MYVGIQLWISIDIAYCANPYAAHYMLCIQMITLGWRGEADHITAVVHLKCLQFAYTQTHVMVNQWIYKRTRFHSSGGCLARPKRTEFMIEAFFWMAFHFNHNSSHTHSTNGIKLVSSIVIEMHLFLWREPFMFNVDGFRERTRILAVASFHSFNPDTPHIERNYVLTACFSKLGNQTVLQQTIFSIFLLIILKPKMDEWVGSSNNAKR